MATSPRAAFQLSQSVSHLLHRAQQLSAERFAQLAVGETTQRQFAVLAAIAENPGQSQTKLVAATGVDRSTLADMMDRMEDKGLIIRVTSKDDARAKAVTLSASGRAAYAANIAAAKSADEAVLEALPRAERKMFLDLLAALAKAADEAAGKTAARAKANPARQAAKPKGGGKKKKPAKKRRR